jgi:hypothetical protein
VRYLLIILTLLDTKNFYVQYSTVINNTNTASTTTTTLVISLSCSITELLCISLLLIILVQKKLLRISTSVALEKCRRMGNGNKLTFGIDLEVKQLLLIRYVRCALRKTVLLLRRLHLLLLFFFRRKRGKRDDDDDDDDGFLKLECVQLIRIKRNTRLK